MSSAMNLKKEYWNRVALRTSPRSAARQSPVRCRSESIPAVHVARWLALRLGLLSDSTNSYAQSLLDGMVALFPNAQASV